MFGSIAFHDEGFSPSCGSKRYALSRENYTSLRITGPCKKERIECVCYRAFLDLQTTSDLRSRMILWPGIFSGGTIGFVDFRSLSGVLHR